MLHASLVLWNPVKMIKTILVLVFLFCCISSEDVDDPWADIDQVEEQYEVSKDPVADMKKLLEQEMKDGEDLMKSDEEFDPVAEMKKLWEQEQKEGQDFKDGLRDMGVDVKAWEEEFGHSDWDEGFVPQDVLDEALTGVHGHSHFPREEL